MKRLFEKYRDDLVGLFWLFIAVFVGAALFSYSPLDPSLNVFVTSKPHNWCGFLGSFLSDLLYQGFGAAAWVVVAVSLRQAWVYFRGLRQRKDKPHWTLDVLLLVVITGLITLHFEGARFYGDHIRWAVGSDIS